MTTNLNPRGAASARTPTSRIATVNAFFAARVRGELDAALALLTEDVTWRVDGSTQVPTIGISRGRDHVRRWLAAFPEHFTPRELRMDKLVADEDDVLALGSFRHTVRSTRRTFGGDCVLRFSFRGDQICRYHAYEDSWQVARAFDAADDVEAEQRLRVNGTVYALSDRGGRGELGPVVLVHGLSHDRHRYEPQIASLVERGHRCIALDLPGHGGSDAPPAGWSLERLAAGLGVLLDERVAGPVALVGLGAGAAAGVLLATARPDRVSRLALLCPAVDPADLTDRLAPVRAPTLVLRGCAAGVAMDALLAFLGPAEALSP
ncbi:MAG: alpha/beta fold hydrolase [Kofleriaceae bacterium]